ncbi:hypothetical protein SAMN02787118_101735 [Streptomyces mirabilis]|jgi:hypothetical protein|uniref:Uncharacterized protein n=1 Tax=Streptomyces mirabilis TaxID=68239 RepID=A0A1I2AKW9_9ACTN|nr:hypothetical protein SAMN02787118_101735 [Streptomyces mirabilis]
MRDVGPVPGPVPEPGSGPRTRLPPWRRAIRERHGDPERLNGTAAAYD